MNHELVIIAVLTSCTLLLAIGLLALARALRSTRHESGALRRELAAVQQDVAALCAGANGVGHHLGRVDRHLMRLFERQDQLEGREQNHREYDHAVRMIQRGAGIEELIGQCGLPRAEAELLIQLHGPARTQRRTPGQVRSVA